MTANAPKLGELITDVAYRDAIHVAVAPVVAGQDLEPGEKVMIREGKAYATSWDAEDAHGVVDPFLHVRVNKGERFWLLLTPNTITSLRHAWTTPWSSALTTKE